MTPMRKKARHGGATCNPNTQEAEAGGLLSQEASVDYTYGVGSGQLELHSKSLSQKAKN